MTTGAVLGIDLGTGSVKAVLVDEQGTELGSGSAVYDDPLEGGAEVSCGQWWASVVRAVRAAVPDSSSVVAIGLTGQMHGVVMIDAAGKEIEPPIIWADPRPNTVLPEVLELARPFRPQLINDQVSGLASAAIRWLLREQPDLTERAEYVLQPKDWLGFRMTGDVVTDASDASATGLWNFESSTWHEEFGSALGAPVAWFPPVQPSTAVRGRLGPKAAEALGLSPNIPVATGLADVPASLLGSGAWYSHGRGVLTLGTGAQLCVGSDGSLRPGDSGLLLLAGPGSNHLYLMAGILSAGLALACVRRFLQLEWADLYRLAWSIDTTLSAPMFLPFVAGERLFPAGESLTAAWVGIRARDGVAELARAALEGCAFAVRHAWSVMLLDSRIQTVDRLAVTGGGARDPQARQLMADVLTLTIEHRGVFHSSARGAAMCAAVAAGWRRSLPEAASSMSTSPRVHEPDLRLSAVYTERYARFRRLVHDCSAGSG